MGDSDSVVQKLEEEENLIAAAQHIVKAFEAKKDLTNETRKILADLGTQLFSMSRVSENKDSELIKIELQLDAVQDKVVNWKMDQAMLWDSGPENVFDYLKAVDEARNLAESLEGLFLTIDIKDGMLLHRAHDVLQIAMTRLDEELMHSLLQNRRPFEPQHLSFHSTEGKVAEEGSIMPFGDDAVEDVIQIESVNRSSEKFIIDLVHPHVIPYLKRIANLMFHSKYGHECSRTFINIRKVALNDCLFILEVEKLRIEDLLRIELSIERWIRAMKIFVRTCLASEKCLCNQIFGELESASSICFAESSKTSLLQLLNFGEAIAIGHHQPDKLFRILDMYEVLADLIPDIDALYSDETGSGSYVRTKFQDVLKGLSNCIKATFLEFENAVASNVSMNPFAGGGVHHLTRYVMSYITSLTDYGETISGNSSGSSSVVLDFRPLISVLECNLDDTSKLYKDESLRHLFLMNNMHYIAEKVEVSELRTILGYEWIHIYNGKFQQHMMNYERATWSSIITTLLNMESLYKSGSYSFSRTVIKEKLQSFYLAFEEVYKSQTAWVVPNSQLQKDLQISIAQKLIPAYRSFIGRFCNDIGDKCVKYSATDLENHLFNLSEGSPKSLGSSLRK